MSNRSGVSHPCSKLVASGSYDMRVHIASVTKTASLFLRLLLVVLPISSWSQIESSHLDDKNTASQTCSLHVVVEVLSFCGISFLALVFFSIETWRRGRFALLDFDSEIYVFGSFHGVSIILWVLELEDKCYSFFAN